MKTLFSNHLALAITLSLLTASTSIAQNSDTLPAIPTPAIEPPDLRVDETLLNDLRPEPKPRLGLVVEDLTPQLAKHLHADQGVYVASVEKDGPAELAGVKSGDVIVRIGETAVSNIDDLMTAVAESDSKTIQLTIEGENGRRTVDITPVMVVPEPSEPMDFEELERSTDRKIQDPLVTSDIIRQLMDQFGQNLDGRTMQDLGGLAEKLLQGNRNAPQPVMEHSLKIEIHRHGDEPAEVFVELDGEQFKTDAAHLDTLPQAIRSTVADLVGKGRRGSRFDFGGIHIDLDRQPLLRPRRPRDVDPPSLHPPQKSGDSKSSDNDAAESDVQQLRREMNELRRKLDRIAPNHSDFD